MAQKKILVAVDGSDYSNKVLDKTIEFARLLNNTEIVFVYCHERFPAILGQPYRDQEISKIISRAEKLVRPLVQRLRNEYIQVHERLLEEPAGKMICEVARIEQCELIIMGSRGLSNLAHLIVGSVTNRVLQMAPCSVLVVR